jgi:hypothetical protein
MRLILCDVAVSVTMLSATRVLADLLLLHGKSAKTIKKVRLHECAEAEVFAAVHVFAQVPTPFWHRKHDKSPFRCELEPGPYTLRPKLLQTLGNVRLGKTRTGFDMFVELCIKNNKQSVFGMLDVKRHSFASNRAFLREIKDNLVLMRREGFQYDSSSGLSHSPFFG